MIGLVGLTVVLLAANFYFYQTSFRNLDRSLDRIIHPSGDATTTPASPVQSADANPVNVPELPDRDLSAKPDHKAL